MRLLIFLSIIGLAIGSCDLPLVYEHAVPPGSENLNTIPTAYQGSFVCTTDDTHVYVTDQAIIEEYYHQFVTTIDKIDEDANCVIVGRGIHFKEEQVCVPFEYISKTKIRGKVYKVDTLFSMSEKQVVREYKGNLFFNFQMPQETWSALMLTPIEDGGFTLRILDLNEDISQIETASVNMKTRDLKDDKTQYIINPTLVEFENIMKKPNRVACDNFIRISDQLVIENKEY